MNRFALLLACLFCGSTAFGFPAPKPAQPPTHADLIVGVWEVTKKRGKIPEHPFFVEFRAEGTAHRFERPGGDGTEEIVYYSIVENDLVVPEKSAGEISEKKYPIEKLTDKVLLVDGHEFRRR